MEILHVNLSGKVRRATLGGRPYLVAHATYIVPGVLNGSQGPIFYSAEENARDPTIWNGMPLVVYHPMENGQPVSARSHSILDKSQIGVALNTHTDRHGVLKGEAWFDVERTKSVDSRIYSALENGNAIELSTGLHLQQRPVENGPKEHAGFQYAYEAYNYKPDHIAILPDQIGACSVRDGCGVLVNQESDEGCGCEACQAKHGKSADQEDDSSQLHNAVTKTEGDEHLPASAYAYVPDPKEPSTWKLRIDDAQHFGGALAAVGKGFRGQKVEIPANDKAGVMAKLRTAWHKYHKDEPLPEVLAHNDSSLPATSGGSNPKSTATGRYKPYGSGTGKGDAHEAAQRGAIRLTPDDSARGADASAQAQAGHNPPSWAVDEDKWEKAKTAADKGDYSDDDYWAVVSHIYQRMGGTIGSTSNSASGFADNGEGGSMDRQGTMNWLIANCGDQWKGDDGKKALNSMSDGQLTSLKSSAEKAKENELLANAARTGLVVGKSGQSKVTAVVTNGVVVTNAKMSAKDLEDMKDGGVDDDEEDDNGNVIPGKKGKGKGTNNSTMTDQEYIDNAPPRVREVLNYSINRARQDKLKLVEKLTANIKDAARKEARAKFYMNMDIPTLEGIVEDMPVVAETPKPDVIDEVLGNFKAIHAGVSSVEQVSNVGKEVDDENWMPTLNFAELAAANKAVKTA